MTFNLESIPTELTWQNTPLDWQVDDSDALSITAGPQTDWFYDPAETTRVATAPSALFTPPDVDFMLSARVEVEFASMFDAGVLRIHINDDTWAKACYEFTPQSEPMIVSVVTHGTSDDCNGVIAPRDNIYLRIARIGPAFAIHYSLEKTFWHLVRYFSLGNSSGVQVGFSAQSPIGPQCTARFSEIMYSATRLSDLRNGN